MVVQWPGLVTTKTTRRSSCSTELPSHGFQPSRFMRIPGNTLASSKTGGSEIITVMLSSSLMRRRVGRRSQRGKRAPHVVPADQDRRGAPGRRAPREPRERCRGRPSATNHFLSSSHAIQHLRRFARSRSYDVPRHHLKIEMGKRQDLTQHCLF